MSEQADRDVLAEVLAEVIPHAKWCNYDDKTPEGCAPDFGCGVWGERREIADAILASDWLAQRDRRVAAEALREAAEEARWPNLGSAPGNGHTSAYSVRRWLTERADRIEAGE